MERDGRADRREDGQMTSRNGLIRECVQQEDWHKSGKSIDRLCGRQRQKWTCQADDDGGGHIQAEKIYNIKQGSNGQF